MTGMKTEVFTLLSVLTCSLTGWAQDNTEIRDSLFRQASSATVNEPIDMTELIVNPNYDGDNRQGWEGTPATSVTWGTWEHWNHPFDNWQYLGSDLPNGVYMLNASALHRAGNYWDPWYTSGSLADESLRTAVLYGRSDGIDLCAPVTDLAACATSEPASEYGTATIGNGCYIPDNPESFHFYTMGGYYTENTTYIVVNDGNLTIGYRDPNYVEGQWSIVDNWQLYYLGDSEEAYALIREQQADLIQDLSMLAAKDSLLTAYADAADAFGQATSVSGILSAYRLMDEARQALLANANAYRDYSLRLEQLRRQLSENEIYGAYRDILEYYLTDYDGESEQYPHGTSNYILDEKLLGTGELLNEMAFMENLYKTAVEKGIGNGTNITYMIKNADFSQKDFEGWEWSRSNSGNFYSRTGGKGDGWQQYSDIWLGEAWNCSFDFHQTIDNVLPDGIYELDYYALFRSGYYMNNPISQYPVQVYMNEYRTPVQDIISDGVTDKKAENHVNCWIDNVGNWPQDDYSEEYGYLPNSSHGASIAFNGGRYRQRAYVMVTDGKLTLGMKHTGKPYNENDWCVWADWQLVYRAHDGEAVNGMLRNMKSHADMLSGMTETYYYSEITRKLYGAIETAMALTDNEEKYAMLPVINGYINDVYASINCYDTLQAAVKYLEEIAFTGNPNISDERYDELELLFDQYMDNIMKGAYTDAEALEVARSIYALPDLDVVFCCGDVIDGVWGARSLLYPLTRQADGHYAGVMRIQDRSEDWGGRASFYFEYQGRKLGRQEGSLDRFFTPAHNSKKLGYVFNNDDDCFNTTGGDFYVDIDLADMTVRMNPIGQYPWPENVYLAGTLPTGYWQRNDDCPLAHQGDGIYEGIVTLEDFQDGKAGVTLFACRTPYDWTHARYGGTSYTNEAGADVVYGDLNRYRGDTKWLVPVGEYCIAFDMNHESIVFCDTSASGADGISIAEGQIQLNGFIRVYTMGGTLIYQGDAAGFNLSSGIYIIRTDKGAVKKSY